jgi:site-specific recombinase XerD
MTKVDPIFNDSARTEREELREEPLLQSPIDPILQKLSRMELPAKEHFERYLRHKVRLNHKPRTLAGSFTSVRLFLDFCGKSGKREIKEIERVDLEGFVEHEQDRGLRISTVRTRLACIIAFLHFLMEQEVIVGSLLKRGIKLKLPDVLPRAMNPADVRKLLCVIDDIRARALFLVLLRTGIRIGEALGLRLNDLDVKGKKVHLFEGEKNSMGRVVYLRVVTALNPYIGYENSTIVAKEALETGRSVYDLVLEKKLLSREEINRILNPKGMIQPRKIGIN